MLVYVIIEIRKTRKETRKAITRQDFNQAMFNKHRDESDKKWRDQEGVNKDLINRVDRLENKVF
jgi:hypothetical protein